MTTLTWRECGQNHIEPSSLSPLPMYASLITSPSFPMFISTASHNPSPMSLTSTQVPIASFPCSLLLHRTGCASIQHPFPPPLPPWQPSDAVHTIPLYIVIQCTNEKMMTRFLFRYFKRLDSYFPHPLIVDELSFQVTHQWGELDHNICLRPKQKEFVKAR